MVAPTQTLGLEPKVILGPTVIVIGVDDALTQPVTLLRTERLALYTAAGTAPGTVITIGVAGKTAFATFTNPAAIAAALKMILYRSGLPVVLV